MSTSENQDIKSEPAAALNAAGREPVPELPKPDAVRSTDRESSTPLTKVESTKADVPSPDTGERLSSRDAVIGTAHVAQLAKVGGPAATAAVQAIGALDAAKVASDVAQGKEVRALDVASAAASMAMTTGVGGPAVQLGAQDRWRQRDRRRPARLQHGRGEAQGARPRRCRGPQGHRAPERRDLRHSPQHPG